MGFLYSHTLDVTETVVDGVGVMVLISHDVIVTYVVGVLVVTRLDKLKTKRDSQE